MKSILKLWRVYTPFKKAIIFGFACTLILNGIQVAMPYVNGKILNIAVAKTDYTSFIWAISAFAILSMLSLVISMKKEVNEVKFLDFDVNREIKRRTSKFMLNLSIGQHHNEHSGVKQSVLSKGEASIEELWQMVTYQIVPMAAQAVFSVIALSITNWVIGCIIIAALAIAFFLAHRLNGRYKDPIKKQNALQDKTGKYLREIMDLVGLIKLNSKEIFAIEEQNGKLLEVGNEGKKVWIPFIKDWYLNSLLPRLTFVLVIAMLGHQCFTGKISAGEVYTSLALAGMCIGTIGNISNLQRSYSRHKAKIERYLEIIDTKPDIIIKDNPVKLEHYRGEIVFKDVCFTYPSRAKSLLEDSEPDDGKPIKEPGRVLIDINLKLVPGQMYAVVGPSGSSKSTLKQLLLRAYDPQIGSITVDGVDLRDLDLKKYHSRIGAVEQDVPLFDRSLRENLTWVLDDPSSMTDDQIWDICKLACIDRFSDRLEKGLDTLIGERGVKLSGGERQRVAIARALMKNPDILIFDEATSSLDAVNEDDIVESIGKVSKGKTTIVIAHRFSTILSADRILVMDKGRLVAEGTHEELFDSCAAYKHLVDAQVRRMCSFCRYKKFERT